MASLLVSAVAGRVADKAIGALSQATRERTAALLRRRRNRAGDDDGEPQSPDCQENDSASGEGRPGLGAEQLREIRLLLETGAATLEITEDRAQQIVTTVLNILEDPAQGAS